VTAALREYYSGSTCEKDGSQTRSFAHSLASSPISKTILVVTAESLHLSLDITKSQLSGVP